MLNSEIASTLGGRFVIMNIYPYSFSEYLTANGKEKNYLDTISTSDVHLRHDPVMCAGNVMTEYEEKFSSMGNPICKLIAMREPKENKEK